MNNHERIWGKINGWEYGRVTLPTSARNGEAFSRSIKTGQTIYVGCFPGDLMVARDDAREWGWAETARPNGPQVIERVRS